MPHKSRIDYVKSQKIIHWVMALLIMLDLFVAQKFGREMELWDRLESRIDHASVGLLVTFLFILRLILRYRYGAPTLPVLMPRWQVVLAKLGHSALYALMGLLMLSGILSAIFASHPIQVYGLYDLAFANHNADFFNTIRGFHEFCTNALIAIIFIHIAAAIYHHFVVKDETMINMTKFWITKRTPK